MTSTKTFATSVAVVGLGLAVAFSAFAFAPVAKAQTTAELQAQIQSLLATIAQLQAQMGSMGSGSTSGGASVTFTRDLTIGSSGSDVTALQNWLIGKGHAIAAGATGYFGAQTQAALAAYQSANAISPASGYFGPITRAKVNASGGTGTGTGTGSTGGVTLEGGEGELNSFDTLGDVEATVDEGEEEQKVLGIEFDAEDSDMQIERVDVEFDTHSGSGSSQLDHYIESVSLWYNGEMLDEMDVDDGDEDDDVWTFRFSGLEAVLEEDETGEIYVAVNVIDSMDSDDSGDTWDVEIPSNGIRAVDADGNSEQYDSSAYEETVTFETADGGDLDVSEASDSPDAAVVTVDEDSDTNDVEILILELEADNQDLVIEDIPVGLVSSDATNGVDGAVKTAYLMDGDDVLDSKSIPSSAGANYEVVFDDLSLDLADGEAIELSVVVDLNDADPTTFATGTTLYATTSGSDASWDVEDEMGDDVTPDGDVTGETMTFETEGITVEFVSSSATKTFTADDATEQDIGTFKITFDVTAAEDDIYLDRTVTRDDTTAGGSAGNGFMWATTTESTTGTTSLSGVISAASTDSSDTTNLYKIDEGETRRFTLTVDLDASDIDGTAAVMLTAINWTTDSGAGASGAADFYTSNLDDFKTDTLSLYTL